MQPVWSPSKLKRVSWCPDRKSCSVCAHCCLLCHWTPCYLHSPFKYLYTMMRPSKPSLLQARQPSFLSFSSMERLIILVALIMSVATSTHMGAYGLMSLFIYIFFPQTYSPCASSSKVSILAIFDFILLCLHLLHGHPSLEITSSRNEFALIIQTSDRSCTFLWLGSWHILPLIRRPTC